MPERMDYIIIGLGALAAVLVTSYVPTIVKVSSMENIPNNPPSKLITLETIPGIDLNSLNHARVKGLM